LGVSFPAPAVVSVTSAGEPAVIENLTLASAPQRGIDVEAGRSLVVRGVLIDDVHEYGALVLGAGAELTLDDVVIRGTRERDSGTGGRGIQVGEGALIRARRLILDANHDVALIVGLDGTAFISDAAVRDTKARAADGAGGRAINAQGGSRVFVERALLTQNRDVAVTVSEGAEVALTDTIIERTLPTEADLFLGRGIELQSGGQVDATRVVLRDNRTTGVYATGSETSAVLRDVVIRDTQAQAVDGTGGRGINVQDGACVEASQLIVADSREIALFVSDPDSLLVLSDVRIGPTYARVADLTGGRGIAVQAGGRVEATRVAFVDNRDVSVFASDDGSAIMLDDVVIRRTLSDAFDSRRGRGLQAQFGASLLGHRVVIEDAREVGVMAVTGATAELSDLRIERVERTACTTPLCLEAPFGYGLAAGTATVSVTRFLVREAATCGVFLAPDAELTGEPRLDLAEGSVRDSAIGACVQMDDYELNRLTRGVSYEDNGTNLEATTLPVPEPVDSLPE
jgi:hypothetical protein